MTKFFEWLITSSSDPEKVSLAVKSALIGVIPVAMTLFGISCGLHLVCYSGTASDLTAAFTGISQLVFFALSIVSIIGTLIGLIRKVQIGRWSAAPAPRSIAKLGFK